jgi:hypothetical protein
MSISTQSPDAAVSPATSAIAPPYVLRPLLGGPSLPPTPAPRRFACQLATPWIVAIAVAFWAGAPTVAWVLAVPLLVVVATNTATNWCLPSLIYGLLHGRQVEQTAS